MTPDTKTELEKLASTGLLEDRASRAFFNLCFPDPDREFDENGYPLLNEAEKAKFLATMLDKGQLRDDIKVVSMAANHDNTDPISTLVLGFVTALEEKLRKSAEKYGYEHHPWQRDNWADELRAELRKHVEKGDPRDVAAYCAFAWHHGWSLSPAPTPPNFEVPDTDFPAEYIYSKGGDLYLKEVAFDDDTVEWHAIQVGHPSPPKNDMRVENFVLRHEGKYYMFTAEFSSRHGRIDDGDYDLTEVAPKMVTTCKWATVKQ